MSLPTPYYEDEAVTIYHGDCREILPHLPRVDAVITDPPYGIAKGAAWVRRNGTAIEDDGEAGHNAAVNGWINLLPTLPDSFFVEFGLGGSSMAEKHAAHVAAGFVPWQPFVFVKQAPPATPRPCFVSATEIALVSRRGKPRWLGGGYVPNAWIGMTPNRLKQGEHPTQEPVELMRVLVGALVSNCVIDPFMGSGTTLRAAKDLGRKAIGIEIEEKYCEIAAKRMAQEVLPL